MFTRRIVLALLVAVLLPLAKGAAAKRLAWDGSRMASSPIPVPPLVTVSAFPNLKFRQPVEIRFNRLLNRFFVLQLNGQLFSFPPDKTVAQADLVLDIKVELTKLSQALGFTFHPKFAENREMFICYALRPKQEDGSHLVRYRLPEAAAPAVVDTASREVLLKWLSGGHNGCSLNFGPDGMLYISTGVAEAPYPPDGLKTGQDISDLLASILRIDVDRRDPGLAYRVPPDNPFTITLGARPEVWAYGFRNPWRMSFDSETGDLWVGDVGWDLWEMIFRIERGGNYGWSIMEGSQPIHPDDTPGPTPIIAPVVQHSHTEARSITGGIFDMRFSDDSKELFVCGMGSTRDPAAGNGKQLWQRFDWRSSPAKKLDETHSGEHGAGLMETLDQHPSGEYFVMAGRLFKGNWNVAFFDTATGKLLYSLDCGMRCTKARFNAAGDNLFIAGTVSQGNDKKKIKQFGRLKVF